MHKNLLIATPLLLATACAYPQFTASKSVDLDVPLAQAAKLACSSHNGSIEVTTAADQAADSVRVHADIEVRGFTQEEADDNLQLVAVGHAHKGDTLEVFGQFDRQDFRRATPSFSFKLRVPPKLALTLTSHNGSVTTIGTDATGPVRIETHNGRVRGTLATHDAEVETHNGDIELDVLQGGRIDATLTTHNGDIELSLPAEASAWIDARTHNGSIRPPATVHDAQLDRRHLRCRVGPSPAEGKIALTTHNGDVDLRGQQNKPN